MSLAFTVVAILACVAAVLVAWRGLRRERRALEQLLAGLSGVSRDGIADLVHDALTAELRPERVLAANEVTGTVELSRSIAKAAARDLPRISLFSGTAAAVTVVAVGVGHGPETIVLASICAASGLIGAALCLGLGKARCKVVEDLADGAARLGRQVTRDQQGMLDHRGTTG